MERKPHGTSPSLKWGLLRMILLCWILPMVLIGAVTAALIFHNVNRQVADTIQSSGRAAVQIARDRLDAAVEASRFASYDSTIKSSYHSYLTRGDYHNYNMYRDITNLLVQRYEQDEKFLFTVFSFYDDPGDEYLTNRDYFTRNDNYYMVKDYQVNDRAAIMRLAAAADTNIGFYNRGGRLYLFRNVLSAGYEPIGVLIMGLDTDVVVGSMKNIPWAANAVVWLNDVSAPLLGEPLSPEGLGIRFEPNADGFFSRENHSFFYGQSDGDGYRFSYLVEADSSALLDSFSPFQFLLAAAVLLLIPMLLLAARFFFENVSKPVEFLMKGARAVEDGELGAQVPTNLKNREFQYLAGGFNEMSRKLKDQFEHIYREELALRDAKIKALQSQINPHFLNNTLEIINWEARLAGNVKVSRMIESLSTMMDAALDRKGKPMIHLSEEMMYVNAYLFIINERLGKRLIVEQDVDESLLDLFVPRLLLQPIIENAVEHGVNPQQKGKIDIRIYRVEESVFIEVENDGGMDPRDEARAVRLLSEESEANAESSGNIGIRNVHLRLRMIYGGKAGLSIRRMENGHALAQICIPLEQSEQ